MLLLTTIRYRSDTVIKNVWHLFSRFKQRSRRITQKETARGSHNSTLGKSHQKSQYRSECVDFTKILKSIMIDFNILTINNTTVICCFSCKLSTILPNSNVVGLCVSQNRRKESYLLYKMFFVLIWVKLL